MTVSVLVLTKNEEIDIGACLASVDWCDDVHVFDSGSSDRTVEIARSYGAHVLVRDYGPGALPFGGDEAAHRNWGLRNIHFKHGWVLAVDADERVTAELGAEICRVTAADPKDKVGFRVRRRDFYLGTWLRHVQATPLYLRLFRPSAVSHQRLINTTMSIEGEVGTLRGYLDHYPFSKGLDHWVAKHNSYSSFEADEVLKGGASVLTCFRQLFSSSFEARRKAMKELFYKLPGRPLFKFVVLYGMKGGFLDGRAGLTYAALQSYYELMIVLKVRERIDNGRQSKESLT